MWFQTNLEFKQNEIKKLNGQYNVEMFHSKLEVKKLLPQNRKLESLKNFY